MAILGEKISVTHFPGWGRYWGSKTFSPLLAPSKSLRQNFPKLYRGLALDVP